VCLASRRAGDASRNKVKGVDAIDFICGTTKLASKTIKPFNIHHHFDHVYGLTDFLANSKLERGRQLMDASGIDRAHTVLIGDTDHDVEVAQELGIDVVIYADGHQATSSFSRFDVPVLRRT
jgi:phosphoglycolate phosphatase